MFAIVRFAPVPGSGITRIAVRIREIVGSEDPAHPCSDDAIASMLKAEGVEIARRTVAKYRAELGVAGAAARRRLPS